MCVRDRESEKERDYLGSLLHPTHYQPYWNIANSYKILDKGYTVIKYFRKRKDTQVNLIKCNNILSFDGVN